MSRLAFRAGLNLQHPYHKLHDDHLIHPDVSTNTEDIRVAASRTDSGKKLRKQELSRRPSQFKEDMAMSSFSI